MGTEKDVHAMQGLLHRGGGIKKGEGNLTLEGGTILNPKNPLKEGLERTERKKKTYG